MNYRAEIYGCCKFPPGIGQPFIIDIDGVFKKMRAPSKAKIIKANNPLLAIFNHQSGV